MSRLPARLTIGFAVVAVSLLVSAAPVSAVADRWAWVVARMPTEPAYVPASLDQGNSIAGANKVLRSGIGRYRVIIGSMGDGGARGTFHVSVLGSQPRSCSIFGWGPDGADMTVRIRCFDPNGARADSKFIVGYRDTAAPGGRAAYFWADQPEAPPAEYTPDPTYSYNSMAAANGVSRTAVGRYVVRLGALGSERGSVQISTYGDAPITCRALDWGAQWSDEYITVRCRDWLGNPADAFFTLMFMQNQGMKSVGANRQAYLWANQPAAVSYTPAAAYRWSSNGAVPTITHGSTEIYTVTIDMPRGGAAFVTPTGGTARCVIGSIRTDVAPQQVVVRCFSLAGAPADSRFMLAYMK